MEPRFRIRARDGLEWTADRLSELCEIVAAGHVEPEDLMYDALTGAWAPASGHPAYRLATDPLVNGPLNPASDPDPEAGDGHVDLVPIDPDDAEETAGDFVRRMEREREEAGETVPRLVPFHEPVASSAADTGDEAPTADTGDGAPATTDDGEPRDGRRWRRRVDRWIEEPVFARSPAPERGPGRRSPRPGGALPRGMHGEGPARRPSAWARYRGLAAAGAVAAATVMIVLASIEGRAADDDDATPVAASSRLVEGNVRAEAYGAFLRNVTDLRDDLNLGRLPTTWLEGEYLAEPSAHPEVRAYWSEVLRFAGEARARERDLYRAAYASTIDGYGVRGPSRSLRLVAAVEAFGERSAERGNHYDRVRRLAMAALTLHDELLALEGRVRYEPAAGPRISMDPVIEAVGDDAEAQLRLDVALDQVLRELLANADLSAGSREAVPRWLVGGLIAR